MNIIPKPFSVKNLNGSIVFNGFSVKECMFDGLEQVVAERLNKSFNPVSGTPLSFIRQENLAEEEYILNVTHEGVTVAASSYAGALYGFQSLRLLAETDLDTPKNELHLISVMDRPEFAWRGLQIDVARHFFKKEFVMKIMEAMSLNKLNVLHMHLTDDQGWRVQIDKYPLLTQIGSKRSQSHINGWRSTDSDHAPHEGFYTKEDLKELVELGRKLAITIVPEIDMPAHFAAAFAAYPELGCRELRTEVPWYFGSSVPKKQRIKDWNRSACIGKKTTMDFIYDVIDEMAEIFPAPYFHIGGDEAPKEEWKNCPACKALMKKEGLADVEQLQGYFTNLVADYLKTKNKRLIGWNEVLKGGNLDKDVVVQYWTARNDPRVVRHVKGGGQVVLSKHSAFYFDMCYGMYPLKNTYSYNPYSEGLTKEDKQNILGVEGEMWTEWIATESKFELHLFPRMQALAEAGWTETRKDFAEFMQRLQEYKAVLRALDINYAEDAVSQPSSLLKRINTKRKWFAGKQEEEMTLNDNIKKHTFK